jgi:ketosteroid isomerase-like protein
MVMPLETISRKLKGGNLPEEVRQWLEDFAGAVRARDFGRGRTLFAPDVVGFGTRTAKMTGLDSLVEEQWRRIWNCTEGFTFDLEDVQATIDGDLAWAAVAWESRGIAVDGKKFQRLGRATYVLHRRGGRWLAIHSHHSLNPSAFCGDSQGR